MRISMDNGSVVCSLENKNKDFLVFTSYAFDGFLNGKLKMRRDNSEEYFEPEGAIKMDALRLQNILICAMKYGVDIESDVEEFYYKLQSEINAYARGEEEHMKAQDKWDGKCRCGCGKCEDVAYDIDLPICKQTGEILQEKNVEKYIGGVLHLFNLEPFPSEDCPFNINKKQGEINVQESTKKTG